MLFLSHDEEYVIKSHYEECKFMFNIDYMNVSKLSNRDVIDSILEEKSRLSSSINMLSVCSAFRLMYSPPSISVRGELSPSMYTSPLPALFRSFPVCFSGCPETTKAQLPGRLDGVPRKKHRIIPWAAPPCMVKSFSMAICPKTDKQQSLTRFLVF